MFLKLLLFVLTISCFINHESINECAMSICGYFLFRWITDYRKCTVSYIECKIRGVKKEKGYIYNILEPIFDCNKYRYRYLLYFFVFIILMINYCKFHSLEINRLYR